MAGHIRVGTASWTDRTLVESGWYPAEVGTPEERLRYFASKFDLVEVDSTYYAPPTERKSALWVARTPADFTFNVKAFSLLTLHPTRPTALYKDLRPETDKKSLYLKDLDEKAVDLVWGRMLDALEPLREAGKLGTLLFQFPPWFGINKCGTSTTSWSPNDVVASSGCASSFATRPGCRTKIGTRPWTSSPPTTYLSSVWTCRRATAVRCLPSSPRRQTWLSYDFMGEATSGRAATSMRGSAISIQNTNFGNGRHGWTTSPTACRACTS